MSELEGGSASGSPIMDSEIQSDSSNSHEGSVDPRSQRAELRQAKQLEREILQLSGSFVSEINQQSECMVDFLDKFTHSVENESHEISIENVDSFIKQTELKLC